jgi:hypothetical protein
MYAAMYSASPPPLKPLTLIIGDEKYPEVLVTLKPGKYLNSSLVLIIGNVFKVSEFNFEIVLEELDSGLSNLSAVTTISSYLYTLIESFVCE